MAPTRGPAGTPSARMSSPPTGRRLGSQLCGRPRRRRAPRRIPVGLCRSDADEIGVAFGTEAMEVARAAAGEAQGPAAAPGHGKQPAASRFRQTPALGDLLGSVGIGGRRAQQRGEPDHGVAVRSHLEQPGQAREGDRTGIT